MAEFDEFGGILIDRRAAPEEQENLGRATDLSFLGNIAQDPVGSAQAAGAELLRTGELGGLEIPRQQQFSPYPMEPGTSRASRELPEMFIGSYEMTPRFEELQQQLEDPELGFFSKMHVNMQLQDMMEHGEATRHVGTGLGEGLGTLDKLQISAAAMTMFDPSEVAQMLTQIDPETGERKWPQFAIQTAPDGAVVVSNTQNGTRAIINRPGFSATDVVQMLGIGVAFTPAGRATAVVKSAFPRILAGLTTMGATEAVIQEGQEMAGGQFDPLDVAISAAFGPLVEVGRPTVGLLQRFPKFISSYLPENLFGLKNVWHGIEGVIPEVKAQVLGWAKNATEFMKSNRPAIITTQDAIPEIHAPWRLILLKMIERMPITGTGRIRLAQREERMEILRNLASRYNLSPNTNYGATVLRDLNAQSGRRLDAARTTINESIDAMADHPVILRDFRLRIRDIIEKEQSYGEMANQGVIDLLNKTRNAVWQGGGRQDFGRGFGVVNDWLERLYAESAGAAPAARATLNDAAAALRRDLERTARDQGGDVGANWLRATKEVETIVSKAEKKTLRGLVEAGEVDQQVMGRILRSGTPDELRFLVQNLSDDGLAEAQQMLMRDAMRVGGWRRTAAGEMNVDANKVLTYFERESVENRMQVLFTGRERAEFGGMLEYLRMTKAAQEIGKGVGMAAAGGVPQLGANAMNFLTLGLIGFAGQGYQSAPVRNLLLRMYHARGDARVKDAIMTTLTPLLMAGGRQMSQSWTESDPQDMVYVSDEFAEVQDERDQGLLAQGMEQLRNAAANEEENPGVTTRLLQMLGGEEEEAPVQ